MGKQRLIYGKYYAGRDSRGYTYYYRRTDGKRVSADTVSRFVREKATAAKKAARDAPKTKDGRFISKRDFEDLYAFMIRLATEPFDRDSMKRVLKFWTREEFNRNIDIAKGMPPRSWWFIVSSFEDGRSTSLDQIAKQTLKLKGSFFWGRESREQIPFLLFKQKAFNQSAITEKQFMKEFAANNPTIYHIDLLMGFTIGRTSLRYLGRSRVVSSEGVIEYPR
jgi:hypothetical protein